MLASKRLKEQRKAVAAQMTTLADALTERAATDPQAAFTTDEKATWDKLDSDYKALSNSITMVESTEQFFTATTDETVLPNAGATRTDNRDIGRGVYNGAPPVAVREQNTTLAMHAWFGMHSKHSRRFTMTPAHEAACEALNFDPRYRSADDELAIGLAPTPVVVAMQEAMAGASRAQRSQRALEAFRQSYGAVAMSSINGATGGVLMAPETMMAALEVNMLAYGGVMSVAEIIRTSDRGRMRWPTFDDTANKGRRLEEGKAVTTVNPSTNAVYWDLYKYTSDEVLVPYEAIEGTPFNLPNILGKALAVRIARKVSDDLTNGRGSSNVTPGPNGIVTAAGSCSAANATSITWDDLENLITSVDPAYRDGAAFMFNDAIRAQLKLLKDGIGRTLWQDGPNSGEPPLLKDYPWHVNQSMDSTIASGKKTILFGQFPQYKVRMLDTIRLYRLVEKYRENDQDAFLAFSELDGNLLNAGTAPVKVLTH